MDPDTDAGYVYDLDRLTTIPPPDISTPAGANIAYDTSVPDDPVVVTKPPEDPIIG